MKTSFSRAFFPAAIILLAALLLVGTSFQMLVRNYMQERAMEELKNDGSTLAQVASAYYCQNTMSDRDFLINIAVASKVSGADAVICDVSGKLLLCSDAPFGCEHRGLRINSDGFLEQVMSQGTVESTGRIPGLYEDPRYVVAVQIPGQQASQPIGIVLVSKPLTETLAVLERMSDIYLWVSLLVVLVSAVVMTIYARKQSAPLKEMAKTASAFGHGELTARAYVDDRATDEVRELALAFNNMAASIEKSEYQRREFVANVSHELKTPMTTIGGYVDGILDGTIPPEKQRHYMQIVSDETKRLSRLVRSMLDISRLQDQGGIPDEQKTRFDVCECAGRVLLTFEQKILNKELDVAVSMPEHPTFTLANEDYITQVIYNLLDNAVKFCPPGGHLGLTVREGNNKLYVSVSNDGATIPAGELPLVFDRFHKLDKSRSRNEGWGLGLYIVKTIVCSHGEDIRVTSADGVTEFTFTLPLIT